MFAKQFADIWTADLVDMSPYSRSNSGYKHLLTVIDVFRKCGWIEPLKPKTGKEVAMTFQKLLTNNVTLYSTENEEKSSVVERWNRTMKNIMWKYFTANNTQKYIDVLPSMVGSTIIHIIGRSS